jgi:hypothetical protein
LSLEKPAHGLPSPSDGELRSPTLEWTFQRSIKHPPGGCRRFGEPEAGTCKTSQIGPGAHREPPRHAGCQAVITAMQRQPRPSTWCQLNGKRPSRAACGSLPDSGTTGRHARKHRTSLPISAGNQRVEGSSMHRVWLNRAEGALGGVGDISAGIKTSAAYGSRRIPSITHAILMAASDRSAASAQPAPTGLPLFWRTLCRYRGSTDTVITGCLLRITGSGPPSRRSPSGILASGPMPRPVGMRSADMQRAETPPAAAVTHATHRDHTPRRRLPVPSSSRSTTTTTSFRRRPSSCP